MGKGISVKELTEIFWFDKNDYNARKNRNAYLRKIRNNLKRVGNVQIKLQNDHFRIFFGSGTACDYHALWTLAEEHKRDGLGGDSALIGLMEALLMRGPLLPNDEMPWMDKFKGTYSSKCTDLLKPMLKGQIGMTTATGETHREHHSPPRPTQRRCSSYGAPCSNGMENIVSPKSFSTDFVVFIASRWAKNIKTFPYLHKLMFFKF